jgi:hypothetical protein
MSERTRKKNPRFLKETSDRSGFDNWSRNDEGSFHKKWQSIKQGGLLIEPEEFDMPPPSKKPLGGADVSGIPRPNSDTTDIPPGSDYIVQYLVAASQIQLNDQSPIMISGSNSAITLSSNPMIVSAGSNQFISILGVGSSVTIQNGNGVSLTNSKTITIDSGAILNLRYDQDSTTWYETSRDHQYYSLGAN